VKKYVKIAIPVFFLVTIFMVVAVLYLLTPAMWTGVITNYLESQDEWEVHFDSISGHLLTTTRVTNLSIANKDSSHILLAPELLFNINPIPWFFKEFSFRKVELNNFSLVSDIESVTDSMDVRIERPHQLLKADIYIKKLLLNGEIEISTTQEYDRRAEITFSGRLRYRSDGSFIFADRFSYQDDQQNNLRIYKSGIQIFPEEIIAKSLTGEYNRQAFTLSLECLMKPEPHFKGELTVNDFIVPVDSSIWKIIKSPWQVIDTKLNFESDLIHHSGKLLISTMTDTLAGEFVINNQSGNYQLEYFKLEIDDASLDGLGVFEKNRRFSGRVNLKHWDLRKFLNNMPATQLSGMVLFETAIGKSDHRHAWVSLELLEEQMIPDEETTLSGILVWQDSIIMTDNPLMITNAIGTVSLSGSVNIDNYQSDINVSLEDTDITILNKFLGESLTGGLVTGEVNITDSIIRPHIVVDVNFNELDFYGIYIKELGLKADIKDPWEQQQGNISFNIRDSKWYRYKADWGSADLSIQDNIISINSLHLKDDENFLQISAEFDPTGKITFDQLRMGYNLHYFVNAKPLELSWSKQSLRVKPFIIHVDDGIMEGFINLADYREGRLKFSNFNSEAIIEHTPKGFLGLSGLLFGEVAIFGDKGDESVEIELSVKNGQIINQPFDDLVVSTVWHDSILHFDEFTLIKGSTIGIQFSGVVPLRQKMEDAVIIELLAELRNVDFGIIRQFMPNFTYLDGKISGEFDISGITSDLRFGYDLSVKDAVYDIIPLGYLTSKGDYQDKRINFYYFESKYHGNEIIGTGSLPVDLDIASKSFGKFTSADSLNLEVTAKTGDLEFLSSYLDVVDSLTGNFDIGLTLSGVPEKIIRNGWFNIDNGKIYTVLLDNTIEDISGSLVLTDNILQVQRFVATLSPSTEFNRRISIQAALTGRSKTIDNNFIIEGNLDMTKFFRPRYDLHARANKAYIRTLLGDIEGLVDVDLTMTGKDTITYSGIISPINVAMKQEFVTSEIDESSHERSEFITEYKITFPITSDFKLINTQLDVDLLGELSLTKFGEQEADYTGELFIQGGKFYYTGDIFTIAEGSSMVFNRRGFNPDFDIQAYTNIDVYTISVALSGRLDNPTLTFESDPFLSQTDILSLLTLRTRIQDGEFASQGFGQLSGSIIGAWFEQQLEKNLTQVTRQLGIVDEVNISGASGLIDESSNEEIEISAQRQLSSKLALNYSYKRSFGLSNNLVGVEYKLNRYLSLVGNYDEEGNLQVKYRLRYSY